MGSNITFGVSTWLWTSPFTTDSVNLFPKIKKMGFDVVEIPVEYPDMINATHVKNALAENGLKAIVCGAFGPTRDLTHEESSVQENSLRYIWDCFNLCNQWGSSFLAGPMYSAVGKARMISPEQRNTEWERAVKNLEKVCVRAHEFGLYIALEPLNRFESDLVNTAEDVVRLVSDINHSSAKILLDSFHMSIEERDMETAVITAGDKLIHVQVSENYRGIPGTGQTDWQKLKKGLDTISYRGVISIESFTPENKELAGAVCIWKNLASNQDAFASEGISFLKKQFNNGL